MDYYGDELIAIGIVCLSITLIIFLICRELICWYFKINKMADIQQETLDTQKKILAQLKTLNSEIKHEPREKQEEENPACS